MHVLSPTVFSILLRVSLSLADTCADTSSLVPFLRAFSGSENDHFYTTNVSEMKNDALAGGVYVFEGESAFLWPTPEPGTVPMFRLYNQNSSDHFYTMSSDEVPEMMNAGWAYDTAPNHTAGYVYPYSICGAAPIYRLFDPTSVDHFYTMDVVESQNAVQAGYQDQGIAGFAILPSANGTVVQSSAIPYLLPSTITASPESQVSATTSSSCANVANAVPLLRAYSIGGTDHFYTTNLTEMNNSVAVIGYSFEGDATFLWPTQEASTVPLYRLWSFSSSDHFYTIDKNEVSEALAQGFAFDTEAQNVGYVYPYSICGASPIYRLFSSFGSDHFYTMNQAESMSAPGYVLEGIAGYALLPSADGQRQTSASPFLLPLSLEVLPVSITLSPIPAFTTSIAIDTGSPSGLPSTAGVQSTVSRHVVLGVTALVAFWIAS